MSDIILKVESLLYVIQMIWICGTENGWSQFQGLKKIIRGEGSNILVINNLKKDPEDSSKNNNTSLEESLISSNGLNIKKKVLTSIISSIPNSLRHRSAWSRTLAV